MANNFLERYRKAAEPLRNFPTEGGGRLVLNEQANIVRRLQEADELAESQPRALYGSYIQGLSAPMQRYFKNLYGDFYSEYLAENIRRQQEAAGQYPYSTPGKLSFGNFLSNVPFRTRYMQLPYTMRGAYEERRLAPSTRRLSFL